MDGKDVWDGSQVPTARFPANIGEAASNSMAADRIQLLKRIEVFSWVFLEIACALTARGRDTAK
jgi:hypothetical protein